MLSRLIPGWTFPKSRVTTRNDEGCCVVEITVKPQRIASFNRFFERFPGPFGQDLELSR